VSVCCVCAREQLARRRSFILGRHGSHRVGLVCSHCFCHVLDAFEARPWVRVLADRPEQQSVAPEGLGSFKGLLRLTPGFPLATDSGLLALQCCAADFPIR